MWLDYLLGGLIAAAVLAALVKIIRDRRKGKGCSCGCGGCPSAGGCHLNTSNQKGRV
jgi:hypothetical protein